MKLDPMEQLISDGLCAGAFRFTHESEKGSPNLALDFHLTDFGIHIEVKRFHSPRIADQMSRAPNVIAAQGEDAVRLLASLLANARYRNRPHAALNDGEGLS